MSAQFFHEALYESRAYIRRLISMRNQPQNRAEIRAKLKKEVAYLRCLNRSL